MSVVEVSNIVMLRWGMPPYRKQDEVDIGLVLQLQQNEANGFGPALVYKLTEAAALAGALFHIKQVEVV